MIGPRRNAETSKTQKRTSPRSIRRMARFVNRFSTEPIHSKVFIITKNRDVIRKVKMTSDEWKNTAWRQYDSSANRKAYLEETDRKSVFYRGQVINDYKVWLHRQSRLGEQGSLSRMLHYFIGEIVSGSDLDHQLGMTVDMFISEMKSRMFEEEGRELEFSLLVRS